MISVTLNGELRELDLDPNTPLLWVLRDHLGLTGTKYGCGEGECGACIVHLDGAPVNACSHPLSAVAGKTVTTIEGLSPDGRHPLQLAWIARGGPAVRLLPVRPDHDGGGAAGRASATHRRSRSTRPCRGVLCRCGTYGRIRRAIHRAANPEAQNG